MESEIEFELVHSGGEEGLLRYRQVSPVNKLDIPSILYLTHPTKGEVPEKISITINIPK